MSPSGDSLPGTGRSDAAQPAGQATAAPAGPDVAAGLPDAPRELPDAPAEVPDSPTPAPEAPAAAGGATPRAGQATDTATLGDAARPGTGEVTATVIVNASADRVYAAFTAWERQGDWIPFTKVRIVSGDGGVGSSIEAITRVGPAVLRDEMRVVKLDPPRTVRVVHYGRMLRGPGVLRCTPMEGGRTQVVWHEWFHLPGGAAGRVAWPLVWPGSKFSLTAALKRFAKLVEAGRLP